jgi:organic radical activating enzyme
VKTYLVKSVFCTLQGEGSRAGAKSVFLRFSGCNLWSGRPEDREKGSGACAHWCDTDFLGGDKLSVADILAKLEVRWPEASGEDRWCVLTGGEPLLQVDAQLVEALHGNGWRIAVETNGTRPLPAYVDHLTVSPKLAAPPLVVRACEEVKVVVGADDWADEALLALEVALPAAHYFVQPRDPLTSQVLEATHLRAPGEASLPAYSAALARCLEFVQAHPRWRLGAQLHKLWGLE